VDTIINGINNEQVGASSSSPRQSKKIQLPQFQPVSFTGRDEDITDDRRQAQRYTLSTWPTTSRAVRHRRAGARLVPISFMSTFSDWADLFMGPPPSGASSPAAASQLRHRHGADDRKETRNSAPVTAFLDMNRWQGPGKINDAASQARTWSILGLAIACCATTIRSRRRLISRSPT